MAHRRFSSLATLALVAAALLCRSAAEPQPAPADASFLPPGGTSLYIRSIEREGRLLLAINDVAAALEGAVAYDAETRSYELKMKGHSAVFGTEAPLAVVDTKLVSLSSSVRAEGATAYADLDFFQRVIGPLLGVGFAFDAKTRVLSAHKVEVQEVSVEASVAEFEPTTRVVLRFSQPPTYRFEKSEGQIVLRFPGQHLVSGSPDKTFDSPRVSRVTIKGSEAAVYLKEKGLSASVYPLGAPPRLVVEVTAPVATAAVTPAASPAAASPSGTPPPERRAASAAEPKTIVLDAGHGGTEEGAKGPEGLLEKDATLQLVRTIKETLARRGYRVVTTRDTDASVGLEDRAAAANAAHADVFVSVHCNASRSAAAHGTEVYYLSLDASDRASAALAESENQPADKPTPSAETNAAMRELDLILWDLAQNQHLGASARLAEIIQADFNRLLGVTTRGVKQAPFKVLIGVHAPAVLVEVAFITNPDEEKKLASDEFRKETAETLAGSLDVFFQKADAAAPVPYVPSLDGRR
ncbi:MAG TPA: N-acetylmuramoyl-L-alanine amidase [Thermoanaerobaculia bacterium]|nr:N-acetylmuramoyl-L-alanine amidase [Thermoanaerobaculia bacterium]